MEKGKADHETTSDIPLKTNDPPSSLKKNQIGDTVLKKETQTAVDNSAQSVKDVENVVKTKKIQKKSKMNSTEVRQQQSKPDGSRRRTRTITKPPVPCFRKLVNKKKAVKATKFETKKMKRKPPIPKFHGKHTVSKVAKTRASVTNDCEGGGAQKTRVQRKPPIPHFPKCRRRKVESNKKAKWCNRFQKGTKGDSVKHTTSEYHGIKRKRKAPLPNFSSMRKRKRLKMQNESDMGKGTATAPNDEQGNGKQAQSQEITISSEELQRHESNSADKRSTSDLSSSIEKKSCHALKNEKVVDQGKPDDGTSITTSKIKRGCQAKPWKRLKSPRARLASGKHRNVKTNSGAGNEGKFKGKVTHKKANSVKCKDNPKAEGDNIGKDASLTEVNKIKSEKPLAGGGVSKDVQKNDCSESRSPQKNCEEQVM